MSAPAYGSTGTYLQGTASTAAFAVPAGVAADDVIVIEFYVDGSTTVTGLPSGFAHAPGSPVRVGAGAGGEHSLNIIGKRATAGDTGTYTVTLSGSQYRNGAAIRYTGCKTTGSFWDANSGTGTAVVADPTNSTTSPAVSMTTLGPDEMLIFATSNWAGGAWTPPTSFTERIDNGDQTFEGADLVQAAAAGTGSLTATCAGSDKRTAWLGALIGTTTSGVSGASATQAHPSTAAAGSKTVSRASASQGRAVVAAAGSKVASAAAGPVAHASTVQAGRKLASATALASTHPATTAAAAKTATGAAASTARPTTTLSAGAAPSASGVSRTQPGRSLVAAAGRKLTTGTAASTARPSPTSTAVRKATGAARSTGRAHTRAQTAPVDTGPRALVGVDSTGTGGPDYGGLTTAGGVVTVGSSVAGYIG